MKSLISRESYRPDARYSGMHHIQGGMVTDADLNECCLITRHRTDNLGDDTIKDGVPRFGGAVAIADDESLFLHEGVIYADGVRGVLTAQAGADLTAPLGLFSAQADFPESPDLPSNTDQVVYADIWERPVFPLEDPYLADAGLHGAVTAFRTRSMTQLKAAPLAALDQIETGTGDFPQIGTASLAVTPLNAEILADECDPCADVVSAEQSVSNALWRLEVIDVAGTPETPGTITLAWSIENAAAIAPAGVDRDEFTRSGKVYEFYSEITESHLGVFAIASDAKRSAFVDDLGTTPSPAIDHNGEEWPYVRRWDGQAVIDVNGANVVSQIGGGFLISINGQSVTLRVDAFEAVLDLAGAAVVAGDYWLVELRRFAAEAERIRLVRETPVGVVHHYCVLFGVDTAGDILTLTDAEVRKLSFPVVSDLPATHIGLSNNCPKLYADAENVQEALDNLCDVSADDIAFKSNCPELYDDAQNVQEAFDALCDIDFSVHASFRLLFDWGVVCGIVPSLVKLFSDQVAITAGAFLDRSGRITRFEGGTFELSKLEFKKEILFDTEDDLHQALVKGEACLALAAGEGGRVSVFVAPSSIAFGPDDPGFRETALKCVEKKDSIDLKDTISKLPPDQKVVANKIVLSSSGDGAFSGSAKLTEAEAKVAVSFNETLFNQYEKIATTEEVAIYKARAEKARQDNPVDGFQGTARQVRQMQQATAVFAAFAKSDDERLRRCVCEAFFPSCPPDLGKPPFLVPIACLRGSLDNQFLFLNEVCPFCCRKQAMTWRSLQYFIGESREKIAEQLSFVCCDRDDDDNGNGGIKPGLTYDPGKYTKLQVADLVEEYKIVDAFTGRPQTSPTDYRTKISVNDLSEEEAKKTLIGNGVEVEVIDVDNDKAFEIIESKSVGVDTTDRLISAGSVRPGDTVGLLVQDGVARGYVLLENGSGKPPFSVKSAELSIDISEEDKRKAVELIAATDSAKGELGDLVNLREALSTDVTKLMMDVEALSAEHEKATAAVKEVETQLTELAAARTAITDEVKTVSEELAGAEKSRKTILTAVRQGQPVTALLGNKDPELVVKLAGENITTVNDFFKLTAAKINKLNRAGILRTAEANDLKNKAKTFIEK